MSISDNTGKFLYVSEAKYPEIAETDPNYIRIASDLAARRSNTSFDVYVAELVDSELKKSAKNQ